MSLLLHAVGAWAWWGDTVHQAVTHVPGWAVPGIVGATAGAVGACLHEAVIRRRNARQRAATQRAVVPASDIQPDPTATAHHARTEADHDLDQCRAIWATRTARHRTTTRSGLEWAADLHKAIRALPETQPSREEQQP